MNTDPGNSTDLSNGNSPRLLIADDDELVVVTLVAALKARFDIVGIAHDGDQAIELAKALNPQVAIIDVQMPAGGGLRATRGISKASPNTAIVILSVDESDQSVAEFMNAGAITYLRKGTPAAEIADRLHDSMAAHKALNPA